MYPQSCKYVCLNLTEIKVNSERENEPEPFVYQFFLRHGETTSKVYAMHMHACSTVLCGQRCKTICTEHCLV